MTDNTQGLEDILDTLAEKSADCDSRLGYVDAYVFAQEAKQALTSLIKELVAEAKPPYYSVEEPGHNARHDGIEQYETNLKELLKALEEL